MKVQEFKPADVRATESDAMREGGCNVYGCVSVSGQSAKVWVIDLGRVSVRVCRRHGRELRKQLPTS